jgi:PAS domain S-box-containing protein
VNPGDTSAAPDFAPGLFELHPTLDALSTFIYVKDRDLRIVSANKAFCQALGFTREKLLGKTTAQYLGEADTDAERIDREVIESGVPKLGVVESFRAVDGIHLVATDKAPILGPDGTVVGLVGTSIDITAQLTADQRLRQNEAQLSFLTVNMADILWTMDLEFRTTYVSPSIERMLGFTPDERKHQRLDEMATPESAGRILVEFRRELEIEATGTADPNRSLTIEVEYFHKDGSTVWTENVTRPIRDEQGALVGILGVSRDITGRRKAEEALRLSEAQLRFLTDSTADVLWTADLNLRTTYVSPSIERVLGFTPEEWIQLPFDRMATPESVGREHEALRQQLELEASGAADPNRTHTIDVEMNHKNGSTVWMEMVMGGIRDDQGRLIGIVGVSRDISERRAAAQALAASEAQKRLILDATGELIAFEDRDLRILWANRAAAESVGLSQQDLVGRHCYQAWSGRDTPCEDCPVRESMRTGTRQVCDRETPDGRHWRLSGSPVTDADGAVIGAVEVGLDITTQKLSERALQQSEEKFRQLFEQSADAVSLVTVDGKTLETNPAWHALFGYTREDLATLNTREIYADPTERDRFLEAIARGQRFEGETKFRRKDGTVFDCHRIVTVRRAADGGVIGFQAVNRDITAQKASERALKESEERFRNLFEQSIAPMSLIAVDGRALEVNQAWLDLFGYEQEDLPSLNVRTQYLNPTERDRFVREIEDKGSVVDQEVRLRRKDGTPIDVLRSTTIRRGPDGKAYAYQNVFRDISAQKAAEHALRESERLLRETELLSRLGGWSYDVRTKHMT